MLEVECLLRFWRDKKKRLVQISVHLDVWDASNFPVWYQKNIDRFDPENRLEPDYFLNICPVLVDTDLHHQLMNHLQHLEPGKFLEKENLQQIRIPHPHVQSYVSECLLTAS